MILILIVFVVIIYIFYDFFFKLNNFYWFYVCLNNSEKVGNCVINIFVRMWKICFLCFGWCFVWILWVVKFLVNILYFYKFKMNMSLLIFWFNSLYKYIWDFCSFVFFFRINIFIFYIIILGLWWNVENSVSG